MRKRKPLIAGAAVLVVLGGGATAAALAGGDGGKAVDRAAGPHATDAVQRGDMTESTSQDGKLGYAGDRRLEAAGAGTLTWLPRTGSMIERDRVLYRLDDRPVRLMYGRIPLYRSLASGVRDGADVRQLEENLRDLGYTGFTVDKTYNAATAAAVRRWQDDHGLKETGKVDGSQIAFLPGPVRVKKNDAQLGDKVAPAGPVLTATGTRRIVNVPIDATEQQMARDGAKVRVRMPDGSSRTGRITHVGGEVTGGGEEQGGEQGGEQTPKINVQVTLEEAGGTDRLGAAPVTVEFAGKTRSDVLSVPVAALLALPQGGYGLQVVQSGATRTVPVKLGMFSEGRVEVAGAGLREGMRVGVAPS